MTSSNDRFFAHLTLSDVTLRVHDLGPMLAFYRDQIGLREVGREGARVSLSATGTAPALVVLMEDTAAPVRPPRTTGLFHLAMLLPDRADLATLMNRLLALGVDCLGASDHGVSEAFYLTDPEGNGVELYADRPAELWPLAGDDVAMVTHSLDYKALLALGSADALDEPLPTTTRVGHLHLSVSDLSAAEKLFVDEMGLVVRQRDYRGALFFGHGGYHHHIAANTWFGATRPPAGSLGLTAFTLRYINGFQPKNGSSSTRAAEIVISAEENVAFQ